MSEQSFTCIYCRSPMLALLPELHLPSDQLQHNTCNVLEPSPTVSLWKNFHPCNLPLVPKRLGTTVLGMGLVEIYNYIINKI